MGTKTLNNLYSYSSFRALLIMLSLTTNSLFLGCEAWAQGNFINLSSTEYKLPAEVDADVLPGIPTELWAKVWLPEIGADKKAPVAFIMHGSYKTCEPVDPKQTNEFSCHYTFEGYCPEGYREVNSHLGFEYLAEALADKGIATVSINSNRGITCNPYGIFGDIGLIQSRGKLVNKHIKKIKEWSTSGSDFNHLNIELKDKLDLNKIILIGHSRGGEAMRAAFNLLDAANSPVSKNDVKGIIEMTPTNGMTSQKLDAIGTSWQLILSSCDGDVFKYDGILSYDRMLYTQDLNHPKIASLIYGANHNFYNANWEHNESQGCFGSAPIWESQDPKVSQRNIAKDITISFIQSIALSEATPNTIDYANTLNRINEQYNYNNPTIESSFSFNHLSTGKKSSINSFESIVDTQDSVKANFHIYGDVEAQFRTPAVHHQERSAYQIKWNSASDENYVEFALSDEQSQLSGATHLIFDIARFHTMAFSEATNFSIAITNILGQSLTTDVDQFTALNGPYGPVVGYYIDGETEIKHSFLKTIIIPLRTLPGSNSFDSSSELTSIKMVFNKSQNGDIFIDDLNLIFQPEN